MNIFSIRPLGRSFHTAAICLDRVIKTSKDRKAHYELVNAWIPDCSTNVKDRAQGEPRPPKKKVALLLGFNGTEYQGMQANPGAHTIESVLFEALCQTGAVSPMNAIDPRKVQLMRAARTDKGVHASCNLVSLKMICQDKNIVQKLNQILPDNIRIWGYVETQRSFHAKNKCDSRIYEYLLPAYGLKQLMPEKKLTDTRQTEKDVQISTADGTLTKYMCPTDPKKLFEYRLDDARLHKFRQAMSMFQGTHNFHNYTISRSFKDPAAKRYMNDIKVSDPITIQGKQWISVKLHGQSFMLHQIRKMIFMAMFSVRTDTPLSIIPKTFESAKINIPKAPALGLLLDRPVFQLYNERMKSVEERQSIDFDLYKEQIEEFKQKHIYSNIFEQEHRQNKFDTFLRTIDSHIDSDYSYFNKDGEIPEHCILSTKYFVSQSESA